MREIARYRRALPVGLDRMFENALDWQHLPHLHRTTFTDATLLDEGDDFWEARLALAGFGPLTQDVRLTLDPATGVWVSEVRAGVAKGMVIHTTAIAEGPRAITVDVRFRVPGRRPWNRWLGRRMVETYRVLYDEDEAMMVERQAQLDRRRTGADGPVRLGTEAEIGRPGFSFAHRGRTFAVARVDGAWIAWSTLCPHWLGPLGGQAPVDGCVECPWHGYRFDVRTGRCLDHPLKLTPAPRLNRDADGVYWAGAEPQAADTST